MAEREGVVTQGNLGEWPLPQLLNFVYRSGTTGRLEIAPAGKPKAIFSLEDGRLRPSEGERAVDLGARLVGLFDDDRSPFEVLAGDAEPSGFLEDRLDPRAIIYQGIRAAYSAGRLDRELEPIATRGLKMAPDESVLRDMGFQAEDEPILAALRDRETTLRDLILIASRPEVAKRVVLALHYTELVESRGGSPKIASARAADKTADEKAPPSVAKTRAPEKKGASADKPRPPEKKKLAAPPEKKKPPPPPPPEKKSPPPPPPPPQKPKPELPTSGARMSGPPLTAMRPDLPAAAEGPSLELDKTVSGEVAFEKGRFLLKKGDYAGAETAFALAVSGPDPRPEYRTYHLWARFSNPERNKDDEAASAQAIMAEVLKAAPNFAFGHYFAGVLWKQVGQAAKAMQEFKAAVELDSGNHEAQRELRLATLRVTRTGQESVAASGGLGGKLGKLKLTWSRKGKRPATAGEAEGKTAGKTGVRSGTRGGRIDLGGDAQKKKVLGLLGIAAAAAIGYSVFGGSEPAAPPPPPSTPKPAPSAGAIPAAATPPAARAPGVPAAVPGAASQGMGVPAGPAGVALAVDELGIPKTKVPPGQLVAITTPAGAALWLDGRERGETPKTLKIGDGAHALVLVKSGYSSVRKTVDAARGLEVVEVLAPASRPAPGPVGVKVRCKTERKYPVLIDGVETGLLCPTERIDLAAGRHSVGILVPADGQVHAEDVDITDTHDSTRVRFAL